MQEYLYHKNNQRIIEQQQLEHQKKKELIKKKFTEEASRYSSMTRSESADGEILPNVNSLRLGGYGSNTQCAIDYANRQIREKIKSEMIAKMNKLDSCVQIKTTSQSQTGSGELMVEDSDDEGDATEIQKDIKLNKVIDQIWSQYDPDKNGTLAKDECRTFIKELVGGIDAKFDEQTFDTLFIEFDEDKSGSLEKEELF